MVMRRRTVEAASSVSFLSLHLPVYEPEGMLEETVRKQNWSMFDSHTQYVLVSSRIFEAMASQHTTIFKPIVDIHCEEDVDE